MSEFQTLLQRAQLKRTFLSPTRRHDPQPLGLVHKSPLYSNSSVSLFTKAIFFSHLAK